MSASAWPQINDDISACCTLPECQASAATKHDEPRAGNHFYSLFPIWKSNNARNAEPWPSPGKRSSDFDVTKFTGPLETVRSTRHGRKTGGYILRKKTNRKFPTVLVKTR